ncbi:MAG: D-alanine--D-alanine ligase [Micavibrio sp.]|nr:D-alanine--D-alanine ligase [Micavibrio sp.]|tara:strand:- start:557 stop:1768 length:1212 start_codon:yes stop_codon:yes gene_type:complete
MTDKKTIAVFFGGRSPEHDVSVVTGLQVLQAIDQTKYEAFPVYITTDGAWYIGDALRERANYLPDRTMLDSLTQVTLDVAANGAPKGRLLARKKSIFGGVKPVEFDVAVPAFHGLIGEDGNIQGLFETAKTPYTGMRTMASALTMDKGVSKRLMQSLDIPTLPFAILRRAEQGYTLPVKDIAAQLSDMPFPVCVKPCHLGSSIGVAKCNDADEVHACLPAIFKYDSAAIVEAFVENMVEYNVAVARMDGKIVTSALERPKNTADLLDFKQKYLSGGDDKTGEKKMGQLSEGMLSLTRELNPDLAAKTEGNIRSWAERLFDALDGTGAPRIDFIGNDKTGDIWMNEINACPGSFGYFLWEAAKDSVLFTNLLTHLIEEARQYARGMAMPADPVPMDARLHKRPT